MKPLIHVQNLVRRFDDTLAVDDVSFTINRGMVYGFIGPNGAGKTTTMRILATIDVPDEGDAIIDGYSVIDDPDRVRAKIGFMPDYYGVYGSTTVHDYLEFFGRAYGLRGAQLKRSLEDVIDFTGIGPIRDKWLESLSKGMKQRVALGRILIPDPDVLILDEPAAGLDPRARVELRELLKLVASRDKAVLISSHILTELSELVDGCAIIEKGRIVCDGTVDEVRALARAASTGGETIELRTLAPDPDVVERFLLEHPLITSVQAKGARFEAEFSGDETEVVKLLSSLVSEGIPVVEFHATEHDLEDVFLAVTKGEIQ